MRKFTHTLLKVAVNAFMISLGTLAFGGILFIIFMLITDPSTFNNASFGIYR